MASQLSLVPSAELRREVFKRGGQSAARCYQCATCSSVCELATAENAFPRRQMLYTQWGLGEKLAGDPSLWLCHQCNDCTERCPREANPGDVMQVARAMAVEQLAVPRFIGKLVGAAGATWWLLLGIPILFWVILLSARGGIHVPAPGNWGYGDVVPHWLLYAVYFPATGVAGLVALVGMARAWKAWGQGVTRSGSFVGGVIAAVVDLITHRRFGNCGTAGGRRWGHFFLFWGFVGAAVTSGFIVIWMYVPDLVPALGMTTITFPIPMDNWMKILGNISAVSLVIGGLWILANRLRTGDPAGRSTAFDNFFLMVVLLVIATGVVTELGRFYLDAQVAVGVYIVHLGAVLCLFLTLPYSKFAHFLYRTLAMVHERMLPANKE